MLKIGHKGACGYEPENTILSFKKALELDVDMIEFDVHKIRSGEVVIIHDNKLDRTTNGEGYVSDKNFEEIRIFDAGKGEKIPTLEEAFDLIDRKVKINIELKGKGTGKATAEIIKNYIEDKGWQKEDFLVSSALCNELLDFIQSNIGIKIGVVVNYVSVGFLGVILRTPLGYQKFAKKVNAYAIIFSKWFIKKRYVNNAQKNGYKAFVFTINKKEDVEKARKWGIDGAFTDYPDRL